MAPVKNTVVFVCVTCAHFTLYKCFKIKSILSRSELMTQCTCLCDFFFWSLAMIVIVCETL